MEPKAQCKVCLSYWDVGIVYCTCGHFYMDLLSIPNYYIKKGRPHGHYEKKPGDYEYFVANSLVKWTNWRTKDHTHHITAEEIGVCLLRSNTVRYDARDVDQALSTLRLLNQTPRRYEQRWKSYSSSWWNWQESWLHFVTTASSQTTTGTTRTTSSS